MSVNYKKLGEIVKLVDERNKSLESSDVLGISIDKEFMPSVANTIGTDLSNYKVLRMNTFACNPMHVGRDERLPVSLYKKDIPAIVSPAYFMFRINNENEVLSDFLMLLFRRDDFDRNCWFRTDGSVRGGITWNDICEIKIPIPDIKEQQKIVDAYNSITKRIQIKQKINENLEKTAQAIYNKTIELTNENESMYITTIIKNGFPFDSDFFNENKNGLPLIRIRDIKNCTPIVYTTEDFSRAEIITSGDLLVGMDGEFSPNFWFGKDSLLNQRVCKLSPSNDNVHIFFIYFSIKPLLENLEKTQGGTTVIHVGKKDFDKINFPRLSIKEHKCFYNNVNSSFRLLIKNKNEILKLQELKQLVISRISKK